MKFYLIDDNPRSVFEIVNTVCCKLWRKMDDLELTIVFYGDDDKHSLGAQDTPVEEINGIEEDIKEKFRELCFAIDRDEWDPLGTAYEKKKESTTIQCRFIPLQELEADVSMWREVKEPETNSGQEIDYSILHESTVPKKLVERIGIQCGNLVALDICLLRDDYERCTRKLPVLSMALHHYLEAEYGCKCFLYSRMSVNTEAKSNWMDVYRQQFKISPPEIHSRFALCADYSSDYQELEFLLTEKGPTPNES